MSLRRGAVVELKPQQQEVSNPIESSPMYGVAMLKIAMELKKAKAAPVDQLIAGVLARMGLDENQFRSFLAMNGGLLKTIAQRRRY